MSGPNSSNIPYLKSRPERETVSVGIEPRFEVIDSERTYPTEELDRFVMDVFEPLEPLDHRDGLWKTYPLRLSHDAGGGWQIEFGPLNLDSVDVERLRQAITGYDEAVGK